jgi:hypothetical protein
MLHSYLPPAALCYLLVNIIGAASAPAGLDAEKDALIQIRNSLWLEKPINSSQYGGRLPWNISADPCGWSGIKCTCEATAACIVTAFNISAEALPASPKLYGNLPDVFGNLPDLEAVDVSHQYITGTIPTSLLTHPKIKTLSMRSNLLHGNLVEPELESISQTLEHLDVRLNMLGGPLDQRLCSLSSLRVNGNARFCGFVPACLSRVIRSGVIGTGLDFGTGARRTCKVPISQCLELPSAYPPSISDSVDAPDGERCMTLLTDSVLARVPVNITFSEMENVDVLVLRFMDYGVVDYKGWFWSTPSLGRAVLTEEVHPSLHPVTGSSCCSSRFKA